MLNVFLFFSCAVPSRGIANLNSPVICISYTECFPWA